MNVLVDSSVILQYLTDPPNGELMDALLARQESGSLRLFTCSTVYSEVVYKYVGHAGGKAPKTLKQNGTLSGFLEAPELARILPAFTALEEDTLVIEMAERFGKAYSMLPNDALILAACVRHGLPFLASIDPDFAKGCAEQGVSLLSQNQQAEAL